MKKILMYSSVLFISVAGLCQEKSPEGRNTIRPATFTNPLLPTGPDPWVIVKGGYYYYMNAVETNLTIWKARSIGDLEHATKKVVWRPPVSGPYSHDIWAPELHFLGNKWHIYFAADAGANHTHRIWVLENPSADPL